MERSWICLLVNPMFYRKGREVLEAELRAVFGDDLVEMKVVLDEPAPSCEFYTFVRCSDYKSHVQALAQSSAVKGVLPSYENPAPLSDEEVAGFVESVETADEPPALRLGDVVRVADGYLENLTGIVLSGDGDAYRVMFRFHTRRFTEVLNPSSLELDGNLFENLKFPVMPDKVRVPVVEPAGRMGKEAATAFREMTRVGKVRRQSD